MGRRFSKKEISDMRSRRDRVFGKPGQLPPDYENPDLYEEFSSFPEISGAEENPGEDDQLRAMQIVDELAGRENGVSPEMEEAGRRQFNRFSQSDDDQRLKRLNAGPSKYPLDYERGQGGRVGPGFFRELIKSEIKMRGGTPSEFWESDPHREEYADPAATPGRAPQSEQVREYLKEKYSPEERLADAEEASDSARAAAGYGSAIDKIISGIGGTKAQPEVYENMQRQTEIGPSKIREYLKNKYRMESDAAKQQSLDAYRKEKMAFEEKKLKSLQDYGKEKLKQNERKMQSARGGIRHGAGRSPQEDDGGSWDLKAVERYQKNLAGTTKQLNEVAASAANVERFAELSTTNPLMAAVVPNTLARAVGEKGPLSNFDLSLWGGSKAVIDRLRRHAKQMLHGTLPESDVKWIKEVGSQLTSAAKGRIRAAEEDWVDKYTSNYGGSRDFNYKLVTGRNRTVEPEAGSHAATATPKRLYSPSRNKTKIVYPDGREEIVDGRKE